ncbi:hypothetical protein HYU13_03295 [Candidatus Woesearchaeota archaeon]|nr:hypothetical protein [Candidatus Woesearchaeota archaeon]
MAEHGDHGHGGGHSKSSVEVAANKAVRHIKEVVESTRELPKYVQSIFQSGRFYDTDGNAKNVDKLAEQILGPEGETLYNRLQKYLPETERGRASEDILAQYGISYEDMVELIFSNLDPDGKIGVQTEQAIEGAIRRAAQDPLLRKVDNLVLQKKSAKEKAGVLAGIAHAYQDEGLEEIADALLEQHRNNPDRLNASLNYHPLKELVH